MPDRKVRFRLKAVHMAPILLQGDPRLRLRLRQGAGAALRLTWLG